CAPPWPWGPHRPLRVYGLATYSPLQAQCGRKAGVECFEVFANGAFALDVIDRNTAIDRRPNEREIVRNGISDIASQCLADVCGPDRTTLAFLVPIDDHPNVDPAQVLRIEQSKLPLRPIETRDRQLRHQEHEVGPGDQ